AGDERAARGAVEEEPREVVDRTGAREDAERDGRGLADLLVAVGEEAGDHGREMLALALALLADLRERDQAARDDLVVRLALERAEQRWHDRQAHLLERRLQARAVG